MMKRLALMALLVAAGFAQGAVSLKVQRIGNSRTGSGDSDSDKVLKHRVTVTGDSKDCEILHLEVCYYGTPPRYSSNKANVPMARETLSFPARAGRKTEIVLQSPTLSSYSFSNESITTALIKVLRGDEPLKAWTDVATLKNKMQKDLLAFKPDIERRFNLKSNFKYEVNAQWQKEVPPGADVGDLEFAGLRFGTKVESGKYSLSPRFMDFDSYSRFVTPRSGKLYKICMSKKLEVGDSSWSRRKELARDAFERTVRELEKKYRTSAVISMIEKYSEHRRAELKFSAVTIMVEHDYSGVYLEIESDEWRGVYEREVKESLVSVTTPTPPSPRPVVAPAPTSEVAPTPTSEVAPAPTPTANPVPTPTPTTNGVDGVSSGEFEFMGQRFGEVCENSFFNPEKKFRRFTSYNRRLTHTTKRLYGIDLWLHIGNIGSEDEREKLLKVEFDEVVKVLEQKYKVKATVDASRSFRQTAELKLEGVGIAVEKRSSSLTLTVVSEKWKAVDEKEKKDAFLNAPINNTL